MKKTSPRDNQQKKFWTYPAMNRAFEVGFYYGFTPIDTPRIEKSDRDAAKSIETHESNTANWLPLIPEEKISLLRQYMSKNPPILPLMFMYERKHSKKLECAFEILGAASSIADATIIKAAYAICIDEGLENVIVEINSLGDRDSINRFSRDLIAYFRKNMNELHPDCKQLLKKDPFEVLECIHEKCKPIRDEAPKPINYLSEPSRIHFIELLEILETTGVPYVLNNSLVENRNVATHTLFRIFGKDATGAIIMAASGARWSGLAKKIGFKKDVPCLSATILIRKESESKVKKIKKPQCYFIQIGEEAKLKSLNLVEVLRHSKIALYHSLTKDKLTAQLASAEYLKVPFILIMGQKESMENTVLVREMSNRSQETIKITEVDVYLKKALS